MVGRNRLDTLWLGVGPGQKLLTICNCCPCCCLWRVLPVVSAGISAKVTGMPGVSLRVGDGCTGCGACAGVCFVEAVTLVDGRAVIGDACRGCGRCAEACPQGAIEIRLEGPFVNETMAALAPLVEID